MSGGVRRHNLVPARDGISAACVGVRRGSAFPLQAAIRHVTAGSASREALKRREKHGHHHQANRDVKSTPHFAPE